MAKEPNAMTVSVHATRAQIDHARDQLRTRISALVREPIDILHVPADFVSYVHALRALDMMSESGNE